MEFEQCFYDSLLKIKKVSNTGILMLELDMSYYEEVGVLGEFHVDIT